MAGAAGCAVAGEQDFSLLEGFGHDFAAAHENGGRMELELLVPAGLGTGLHEPELVVGVDAELGVHDDAAVGLAHGAHATGNDLGLAQGQGPAQGLELGHVDFLGAAALVVDDFHGLAAHLADDDFRPVVALEDVELVGRHLAADDRFAEAVGGVDGDEVVAVGAAAARGGVGRKGGAGDHGVDHLHDADGEGGAFDGPVLLGLLGNALVAQLVGFGEGIEDGLAAVGHGAQVVGGGAVPVVGFSHVVGADLVQVGVLQAREGFLAGVFAGCRGAHGHGGHVVLVLAADVAVGAAHGGVDFGRQRHGEDGRLHHDGALAQLVDALGRGRKALDHVVDEGPQLRGAGLAAFLLGGGNLLAELADEFLQVVGIAVDFRVVPVDAVVFLVDHFADDATVDLGFVQDPVEGHRGDGPEVGGLDFLDLADDGSVVVFAANKELTAFTKQDDVRAGQDKLFLDVFRRGGLGRGLGGFVCHGFLRDAGS